MAPSRTLSRLAALSLVAGCASTVGASTPDASPTDLGSVDAAATDVRTCPSILDDDVPPVDVPATGEAHVVAVDLVLLHQCALMSDGTVRCRGSNAYGALGRGTVTWRELDAAPVPGVTDAVQVVSILTEATCTRHRDGTVRCWGSNQYNQLGTGHEGDSSACSPNGPCRPSPTLVAGLADVVHLAAGSHAICAVKRDGSVWCWGRGDDLLPAGGAATPVRIEAFADVAQLWSVRGGWIARLRSGAYVSRGVVPETGIEPTIPTGAVIDDQGGHAPRWHLCYRLPDGSVRCFGQNDEGQRGIGATTADETFSVEPSDPGLCGVRSVASAFSESCALMADRTVRCWGDGVATPTPVAGLDDVDAVFLGYRGRCARRRDRSVWCWGRWSPYAESPAPTRVDW